MPRRKYRNTRKSKAETPQTNTQKHQYKLKITQIQNLHKTTYTQKTKTVQTEPD